MSKGGQRSSLPAANGRGNTLSRKRTTGTEETVAGAGAQQLFGQSTSARPELSRNSLIREPMVGDKVFVKLIRCRGLHTSGPDIDRSTMIRIYTYSEKGNPTLRHMTTNTSASTRLSCTAVQNAMIRAFLPREIGACTGCYWLL